MVVVTRVNWDTIAETRIAYGGREGRRGWGERRGGGCNCTGKEGKNVEIQIFTLQTTRAKL